MNQVWTDPTEDSVRDLFDRLVEDEPPMATGAAGVAARARRRRRGSLAVGGGALAAVAAAASVALVATLPGHPSPTKVEVRFAAPVGPVSGSPVVEEDDAGPHHRRDVRPPCGRRTAAPTTSWCAPSRGRARRDGPSTSTTRRTKTNGRSTEPPTTARARGGCWCSSTTAQGKLQRHPCLDSEYRQGASCVERAQPDGSILSIRGLVDYHGVQTYEATLTRPDGTGVGAESGNFTLPPAPAVLRAGDPKPTVTPTRPAPTYDADQLAAVVLAVDHATR